MDLDDYREASGFTRQTAFVAAGTAARLRRLALKRNRGANGSADLPAKSRAARGRKTRVQRPESRVWQSEHKKRLYAGRWQPRQDRKAEDHRLLGPASMGGEGLGGQVPLRSAIIHLIKPI